MEERVFLNESFARVSSSKIEINGATYATRNVGSVRVESVPRPLWPILVIAFGVILLLGSTWPIGLILLATGALCFYSLGPKAKLHLMAGGGEQMAIESKDIAMVASLHRAVVEAISAR